jgi:WD40 repeat protein
MKQVIYAFFLSFFAFGFIQNAYSIKIIFITKTGHTQYITDICFDQDKALLVTASADGR